MMRPATPPARERSLRADRRGAIIVMGLFMSVLLVALLYYVIGAGDAILFRQSMQDASDGAAYSAAVIHARGMNIIVMINVLMAALLAVLVVLRLLSSIATAAIGICVALAFWTAGASMAPVPFLKGARSTAESSYTSLRPVIFTALQGGNKLANIVRRVTPIAAQIEVQQMAMNTYAPPSERGVMFPLLGSLPTEDGDFGQLCRKAGSYAGTMAAKPLELVLRSEFLTDLAASGVGSLAETFSQYFCGDGGAGGPPSYTYKQTVDLPRPDTPEARACDAEMAKPQDEQNTNVLQGACEDAAEQAETIHAAIDSATGDCAGPNAPLCETHKDAARAACAPGTANVKRWWWQQRRMRRTYELVREEDEPPRVELVEEVARSTELAGGDKGSTSPPCRNVGFPGEPRWSEYTADASQPACRRGFDEPTVSSMTLSGDTRAVVEYDEVTDLIGCQQELTKKVELSDKIDPLEGGRDKAPQRIKPCADLGEDMFQVKVALQGNIDGMRRYEPGVALATWGVDPPDQNSHFKAWIRQFGRFSAAQAEYFYAGDGAADTLDGARQWKDEWMWNMAWRARLRRFQLESEDTGCVDKQTQVDGFSQFAGFLGQLDRLFLH